MAALHTSLPSCRALPSFRALLPGGAALLGARGFAGAAALPALEWEDGDASDATQLITDLGNPASFFPVARALRRRIVAHLGPTNSGKTHAALEDLRRAGSGVYAGPLRLLAWQVHDALTRRGLPTSLVTGQERRLVEGSRHTACTAEMASTRAVVECGVLDEVQMLGDAARGWAWTRALLGMPARTLHVCGDPAALPLLERLVAETGDDLEVRRYERLAPLVAARRPLADLSQVARGDCVVSFSRRDVHAARGAIEAAGHRCCVVYGALPPDARQLQAALFNRPRSGYGVLSASDAVGMGLNLAIRRVVFTGVRKFDGTTERPLTVAEIKQVAGRAGRFGGAYGRAGGVVTALSAADLAAVADALEQPSEELHTAYVFPSLAQMELLHGQYPADDLPDLLHRFADAASGSLARAPHYAYARYEEVHALACMLRHLRGLSLREAWTFAISPTDPADAPVAAALLQLATAYAQRRRVTPAALLLPPLAEARSELELQQLEASHRVLDLFCWLAWRFPDAFVGREAVEQQRAGLTALIDASLRAMGAPPRRRRAADEASQAAALLASEAEAEAAGREEEVWLSRRGAYHQKAARRRR